MQHSAERLYELFTSTGGPALVGPAAHLAKGTFWLSE